MSKEIAEALNNIASALWGVANAITPTNSGPGKDAVGGTVDSLTEAVMGITKAIAEHDEYASSVALEDIANAIGRVADKE